MKNVNRVVILLHLFCVSLLSQPKMDSPVEQISNFERKFALLNVGNWEYFVRNDGVQAQQPNGLAGGIFPKNTDVAVYQSGLVYGGFVDDIRDTAAVRLRVGGSAYRSGMQPGRIMMPGTATAPPVYGSPDEKNQWRIRRDWQQLQIGDSILIREAALQNPTNNETQIITAAMQQEIIDQYQLDWETWPVEWGAPFIDHNRNGVYDFGTDEPGIAGADQVVWQVVNDAAAFDLYLSPPIGLEIQETFWTYNSERFPFDQLIFMRYQLINKSGLRIDSMFVGQWSDSDIGSFVDDLAGCDRELSLGYGYNGNSYDVDFQKLGLPAPAAGFQLLQGPVVAATAGSDVNRNGIDDISERAVYNFRQTSPGFINLPMTSFAAFLYSFDEPCFCYDQTIQYYNSLNGYENSNIVVPQYNFLGPSNGLPTKFPLDGDPIARTGDIDGFLFPPGDRRWMVNTGAFTLMPGDTQEVIFSAVGGIIDADENMSRFSVQQLKRNARAGQYYARNLFRNPFQPGPPPDVQVSEQSTKIVLEWGTNQDVLTQIESAEAAGFYFEGYNVYQLASLTAPKSQAKRILTFDKANLLQDVLMEVFLPEFGIFQSVTVLQGSNNGVRRFVEIDRDLANDKPLYNGTPYSFGVTGFYVKDENGDGINDTDYPYPFIETGMTVVTAIPQNARPGFDQLESGDIAVTHTAGNSDGAATVYLVNPQAVTGHSYEVFFTRNSPEIRWNLQDITENKLVFADRPQADVADIDRGKFIADGFAVKVATPKAGVRSGNAGWSLPSGEQRFGNGGTDLALEGFAGAIGYFKKLDESGAENPPPVDSAALPDIRLVLATAENPVNGFDPEFDQNGGDANVSFAYRWLRNAADPPARPEFAPNIANAAAGYAFQDFSRSVPLAAFDISDPENPRRLAIGFLENNVPEGLVDGKYWPPDGENVQIASPREWLFIMNADYRETPDSLFQRDLLANSHQLPIMYLLTVSRRPDAPFSPGNSGADQFEFYTNRINSPGDVFRFQLPENAFRADKAAADVDNISVFPNPYYGGNPQESGDNLDRFVTFAHLPERFTMRIFTLSGQLVTKITERDKDPGNQFLRWHLRNDANIHIASGLYIIHIEMPELNKTKVLKLMVVQDQEQVLIYQNIWRNPVD